MFRLIAIVGIYASGVSGFVPPTAFKRAETKAFNAADSKATPLEPFDIDVERARDCADHFGKCSVEEMEKLRSSLHKERVQNFLMDTVEIPHSVDAEEVFQHRMLEEDLSLQLSMLKDQMPADSLFPEQEPEGMLSPRDHTLDDSVEEPSMQSFIAEGKKMLLMEESIEEAMMICAAVALVAMVPALLQV